MKFLRRNTFITLLLGVVSLLYLFWAMVIPFGEGPDEPLRYDIGQFIYKYHELPEAGDPRLGDFGHGVSYAPLPQFPYIIGGLLMIFAGPFVPEHYLFYVHRLVSVIPGVISVLLVYLICSKLNLKKNLKMLITCLFAFVPQYAFVNSYVNQESFSICVNIFIIYIWIKGIESKWNMKSVILLAVGISLSLLSYLNGYVTIPVTGLILLLTLRGSRRDIIKKSVVLISVIFVLSGWWFIRNFIIYNGDFLGLSTMTNIANELGQVGSRPIDRLTPQRQGISFKQMFIDMGWFQSSYRSFWAVFGGMNIPIDIKYYLYIGLLHFISLIGLVIAFRDNMINWITRKIKIREMIFSFKIEISLVLVIFITFGLTVYYSYYSDFQPQGRYLFPALFPIIYFIGIGFDKLFKEKVKPTIYILLIIGILYLNLHSLFNFVIPRYYL